MIRRPAAPRQPPPLPGTQANAAPPVADNVRLRLCFEGWVLDLVERRLVAPGGGVVRLPALEFALLRAFVTRPRRVLSRSDLARAAQREGRQRASPRAVDVYVGRVRRILGRSGGAPLIATVRAAGYVFDADVNRR